MKKTWKSDESKVTLADAGKMLTCSQRTIQRAIRAGRLEPVHGGVARRVYWVTRASVNAILKGGAA
ncbi:MAG: hypothetical protein IJI36_11955 [Kiritimatiellae bacterium]|nr:hypothetical protein [Kiritimatiellia bacterium]